MIKKFLAFCIALFAFLYPIPYTLYPTFAQTATLSLSPSSGTFNKGCSFSLAINLNTGGAQTDGTDSIIIYDTARFQATSVSSGTIYPDYPGNNIDEAGGKVTISGLSSITSGFSGSGTLATINFKVKDDAAVGASQIKFDFDPKEKSKTTDSNVVERGTVTDILNSVVNGNYTVGSGSCVTPSPSPGVSGPGRGAPGVSTPSTPSTPSTTPKTIDNIVGGKTGTPQLTYTIAIVGMVLTILGILGLALL